MRVEREWLRSVIFGKKNARRFTQDSPVLPEVWLAGGALFCLNRQRRLDLLLSPHRDETAGALGKELQKRLKANTEEPRGVEAERGNDLIITRNIWTIAVSQVAVAVSLTLDELVTAALPLTPWWNRNRDDLEAFAVAPAKDEAMPEVRWMREIVGILKLCAWEPAVIGKREPNAYWFGVDRLDRDLDAEDDDDNPLSGDPAEGGGRATNLEYENFRKWAAAADKQRDAFAALVRRALRLDAVTNRVPAKRDDEQKEGKKKKEKEAFQPPELLWSIGLNRRAQPAIYRSVSATKADAARRLFDVKCRDLTWAVVDSGIDARHAAFRTCVEGAEPAKQRGSGQANPAATFVKGDRVTATYDFTRLRTLITLDSHPSTGPSSRDQGVDLEKADRAFKQMRRRLRSGQALDWVQLEPLLRVRHETELYRPPGHDHGTHVAGILGGCEIKDHPERGQGMCPDINMYDLRVLDADGKGDEFSIIAALQFIRYLNATADQPVIHGVNLSLSLIHDVENFACGRTPICEECERLVASGVVVVAAAGNRGFERVLTGAGEIDAYRAISITDPGNADGVITVGATHRFQPHTYGVSYFSSRGPTGDGRIKPDLLAPGERVYSSLIDDGYGAKDGTSQAAPHVSGVAAMLMARHREFLGQPAQIKRILMKTATDLGRERYFQGAGMVDALRALQSV